MEKINKKHIWNTLKLALGLLIIVALLNKFNFNKVMGVLKDIPWVYGVIIVLIYVAINISGTLKTSILLKTFHKKAQLRELFKDCSLSWALGLFIPGKVGELSLIYLLKKYKTEIGPATAIVMIDKIYSFLILSAMSIIGFFMFLTNTDAIKLLVILMIGYTILFFFIFSEYGRNIIKKFILRKKSEKFKGFSKSLFFLIREHKLRLLYVCLLTLLRWVLVAFTLYILLLYFKQPTNYIEVLFIFSAATIISFIPITFNGLGLKESSAVVLFNIIGVNSMVVFGSYLYLLVLAYILGIFHLLISLRRIKEIK